MTARVNVPALVGLALVAGACGVPALPPPPETDAPVAVAVGTVDERDWPSVMEAGGVLRSQTTAVISSRLLAPVVAVHVRPGDRVTRGQLLVELDAAAPRADAARAVASLEAARLALQAAEAELSGARAAVVLARTTHGRIRQLADTKSATAQELDEATAGLAAAESRAAGAAAGVERAAASLEAARAGADASTAVAAYATLRAPFDGIVVRRDVDPGTTATPGAPLLVLEDPAALRLEVDLDATRAAGITNGVAVGVRIDTDAGASWVDGRVVELARLDTATTTYRVTIAAPASDTWRSGQFGRARFTRATRPAVTAPVAAIVRRGQLTFAFVVGTDDVARLRVLRIGDPSGDRVEVLAGAIGGERMVLDPPDALADGSRVTGAVPGGAGR